MASNSLCFPFEKSIVINALYDTIEALGLCLDKSNSARGTLIVTDAEHTEKMRIALSFDIIKNQTLVEIFPDDPGARIVEVWSPVIMDEISGRMKHLHQLVQKSTNRS